MIDRARELLRRLFPLLGTLYLVYLALQPPPVRWMAIGCLAIVTPLLIGWILGNVAGIGPWADGGDEAS